MKPPPISARSLFAVFCLSCHFAAAQDIAPADGTVEAPRIIGDVADGTPAPPAPKPELPDSRVLETTVRQQGGRSVTIQKIVPPDLPEAPAPRPPPDLSDPEVQAQIAELQAQAAEFVPTTLVPLSVTVYDHQFTFLRWTHRKENGEAIGYAAWSNIDFNHLCGFGEFETGPAGARRRFALLMGIGNIETARLRELAERSGAPVAEDPLASLPALPADRPAFVLVEGDPDDAEAVALIQGLHDIYAREKDRLVAAYEGRERVRKEREAYLLAHPPKPEDITIRYWRK